MNKKTVRRITSLLSALGVALGFAAAGWAAQNYLSRSGNDEFFIVISLNMPKHQLVLKMPTAVTVRMNVNDRTKVIGEDGKPLPVSKLQAGDTAYITYATAAEGPTATLIRLGPMTWTVLQQRYLSGSAKPVQPPPLAPILNQGAQAKQGSGRKQAGARKNFRRHTPGSQGK